MRKEWTQEEDARLIQIANDESSKLSTKQIATMFDRSEASVKHRATRLGCPKLGRQRVYKISDEMKERMRQMNDEGVDCKKIAKELGLSHGAVVTYIRANGGNSSKWTEDEIEWLRLNYPSRGGQACADHLKTSIKRVNSLATRYGIKREHDPAHPVPNMARRRVFDEEAICKAYETAKDLKEVATLFDTDYNRISTILKKHGVKVELYSRFRECQDSIVRDYQTGTMSTTEIGKKHGLSNDRVAEGLKELGLHDPTRYARFGNRKGVRDNWVAKHGEEIGGKMYEEFLQRRRDSGFARGKNNPMYGKPSPQGAGNGWKGWYRGHYFRSLREVMFMIDMDERGLEWKSAETKTYTIPYEQDGVPRTYRPDFIVGSELWELKPIRLHNSPNVTTKRIAAERFCSERGLTYRLEDVDIEKEVIHEAWKAGLVRFDRDYEKRFLEYVD